MALKRSGKYAYGYNAKYSRDRRPWRDKSRSDKRKKVASYFLVFLLSFITVLALLFNALFLSFFNNSKISSALCNNDMYTIIQAESKEEFEAILSPYGIPVSAVSNALDNSYVYQDMKVFLGNSDGIFDKFDLVGRKQIIKQDLNDFYKASKTEITPALSEFIDKTADKLLESYTDCINLPLWPKFLSVHQTFSSYSIIADSVLIAVVALIIIKLKQVNKKYIHRFFRYMCESSWTVALSSLIGAVIVYSTNMDIGSQISQKQYSMIFNSLSDNYATALLIFGAFMLAIGIVFFIYSLNARKELIWHCSHKHLSPKDAEQFHSDIAKFIEDGGTARLENEENNNKKNEI